jgi:2-phosphosulfolactate phosphatase
VADWFTQAPYGVRFEWGPSGAARVAPGGACLVVVDVLSFTTAVSVAVDAGTRVYPYPWRDETATAFAARMDAALAVGRRSVTEAAPWSLSPAALRRAPFTPRLVLPSPNGSAISATATTTATATATATTAVRSRVVVAGCLRNASAVGRWLAGHGFGTPDRPLTVIAAGEGWPDGSLRPALEDLLGAGAIIAALHAERPCPLSPEAAAACATFQATPDPAAAVADCASGRELTTGGFADDVAIAVEIDASGAVPVLSDGAFTAAENALDPVGRVEV